MPTINAGRRLNRRCFMMNQPLLSAWALPAAHYPARPARVGAGAGRTVAPGGVWPGDPIGHYQQPSERAYEHCQNKADVLLEQSAVIVSGHWVDSCDSRMQSVE